MSSTKRISYNASRASFCLVLMRAPDGGAGDVLPWVLSAARLTGGGGGTQTINNYNHQPDKVKPNLMRTVQNLLFSRIK
jgi:hypothetical protein